MSKDPAFLFYPNDYIGGTMGMTLEEKGAYIELLMMQFNRGHMGGHMIGQTIGQLWDKVKVKFVQDDKGLWYNVRLEEEQNKRKAFTNSRKNNLLGINQYSNKGGHKTDHMEDEDEDVIINKDKDKIEFDIFWDLYDKKIKKRKVKPKWDKLTKEVQQEIIEYIPKYIESQPDKQYRLHPETFLNNESWNDEIIYKNKDAGKESFDRHVEKSNDFSDQYPSA